LLPSNESIVKVPSLQAHASLRPYSCGANEIEFTSCVRLKEMIIIRYLELVFD